MNALLVFDPANDLLLVKASRTFRARLLRYARLNGLQAGSGHLASRSASQQQQQQPLSTSSDEDREGASKEQHLHSKRGGGRRRRRPRPRESQPQQRPKKAATDDNERHIKHRDQDEQDDQSADLAELLMLLLTPYVASLRLSGELERHNSSQWRCSRPTNRAGSQTNQSRRTSGRPSSKPAGDLLNKFMSSISINHECGRTWTSAAHEHHNNDDDDDDNEGDDLRHEEEETSECEHEHERATVASLAGLRMPVECLADCQVAYCDRFGFVFLYLQQLAHVSSFKLRLLRRRVELFARLALFLFGRALGALRTGAAAAAASRQQASLLRHTYDVWFARQFQAHFFLEASEPLILGSHMSSLCAETLRQLAVALRREELPAERQLLLEGESHQHSLLFAQHKLVSRFTCRNATPLAADDLQLVQVLLATHLEEQNGPPSDGAASSYKSHFHTNRHTSQISSSSSADVGCSTSAVQATRQVAVFLRAPVGHLYAPHMLRFVALARDVTLILISELSPAVHLSAQLSSAHSLLLDFQRRASLYHSAGQTETDKPHQLRLAQVRRLNNSVAAIRRYFLQETWHPNACEHTNADNQPASSAKGVGLLARMFGQRGAVDGAQDNGRQRPLEPLDSRAEDEPQACRPAAQVEEDKLDSLRADGGQDWCERRRRDHCRRPFERLTGERQRVCRHLLRRLAELAQNNVQTYMRQTFGLPLDEHKREALLTSVCASLREAQVALVLEPQLERLHPTPTSDYLRHWAGQMDGAKRSARQHLGDYFDYLAVKAQCNVTLGAPLTHDMRALTGFIYLDRARQQLVMAPQEPMEGAGERLSWRALVEGDLEALTVSGRRGRSRSQRWFESATEATGESSQSERLSESELSSQCDRSSGSFSSTQQQSSCESSEAADDERDPSDSEQKEARTVVPGSSSELSLESIICAATRRPVPASYRASRLAATSQDVSAAGSSSAASSSQSMRQLDDFQLAPPLSASSERRLDQLQQLADESSSGGSASSATELMRDFTAFIYNRLAAGKTGSFSGRASKQHRQLSYFLWFQRIRDGSLLHIETERRRAATRQLATNFRSLPNVTCDDFFARLTRSLVSEPKDGDSAATNSSSLWSSNTSGSSAALGHRQRQRRRVQVLCQLRELDAASGRPIAERQLARVHEETEHTDDTEADLELKLELECGRPARARRPLEDFGAFLRNQAGARPQSVAMAAAASAASASKEIALIEPQVSCCELFLFHDARLLVHRGQVALEAQRLARRLAHLLDGAAR